jgi:hypothetical protein
MNEIAEKPDGGKVDLPQWIAELIALYESNAASQFILHGNVNDRLVLPLGKKAAMGSIGDVLLRVLMPTFDVVLSYGLGNGIRVEKGGEVFAQWPQLKTRPQLPRSPLAAIEALTHYFRYCANLSRLGRTRTQVGCIIHAAHLVTPAMTGGLSYDLSAMALLIRDWTTDSLLTEHPMATFLVTENLNDLHPLLVNNPRSAHIKIPLPSPAELKRAFELMEDEYKVSLSDCRGDFGPYAHLLTGATLSAIESLLKTKEYRKQTLETGDLVKIKKDLVERECNGLVEFIDSKRTMDDLYGQEKIKDWLRQDIVLWKQNDLEALPMGYLLCGPVGTGKTYMVECLAGEAGVPVVKLKNFRDRWVGSTEGNLEKIFMLLHALGRCFVFIDEADQVLGKRDAGGGDSNVSGRVYAMIAQEMSNTKNRGKIVWILASSRPDLIEVDLKRPGRVDVKIPIFPTSSAMEGFELIRGLCHRRGMDIDPSHFELLGPLVPSMLTPGAAEALAVKVYRLARTRSQEPVEVLRECLTGYQNPVSREVMDFQIGLAVREATDLDFVPSVFRSQANA